jgi:tRNA(fMet)-specific endonuclease VapC
MSRFMLDTDVCIELLRGRAGRAFQRMRRHPPDQIGISSITLAELQYGAAQSARPAYHAHLLVEFCAPLAIFPFDSLAAETYGPLRADLERKGTPIGPMDNLLAAHALSRNLILITNNKREFRRVAGLSVENWL